MSQKKISVLDSALLPVMEAKGYTVANYAKVNHYGDCVVNLKTEYSSLGRQ